MDKHAFIQCALDYQVLRFGEFTLKSGRKSPYFFNAGLFYTGTALAQLGRFYADALQASGVAYDMLFGPAYKGIPLVSSTAIALSQYHQKDTPYCFDRKEAKDHGEGGQLVGAPLKGRVVIVDDVITAGTAIRHSLQLIRKAGASVAAILVCLDRQERGLGELSAIQEIQQQEDIPVFPIIQLADLLEYVATRPDYAPWLDSIRAYQAQYGIQ